MYDTRRIWTRILLKSCKFSLTLREAAWNGGAKHCSARGTSECVRLTIGLTLSGGRRCGKDAVETQAHAGEVKQEEVDYERGDGTAP